MSEEYMIIQRPKRTAVVAACLLLASCRGAQAQDGDSRQDAVDKIFAGFAKPASPGCAVGVYRDGKMIYAKGYGLANLEQNVSITPKTLFDIGSTSKQFTAASILLLEKQGKLSLNDDVRKYIPELPDYGKKITILHLLNHTSGLRDYLTLMELAGINTDNVTTDEDALWFVARQKALNFDPGSEWLYSNTGFFLLSVIVKRISGKTLREFAAENIFTPLKMSDTQFRDDHTQLIPNRALAYEPKENKDGYTLDVSYFEQTGDGAVHTSVEDLLKWDENFYTGQIGGKAFLAEIQEQARLNNGKLLEYAKGLSIENYRGLRTVRHGGSWGGYRAELLRFPEQHFSVACLCNAGNADPEKRAEQTAEVYLAKLMKASEQEKKDQVEKKTEENSLSASQLGPYAGDFYSQELGVVYQLRISKDKLTITAILDAGGVPKLNGFSRNAFRCTGDSKFNLTGTSVILHFSKDPTGIVNGFILDDGRTKGMQFQRMRGGTLDKENNN
jgi:CubicO group peptidase (beta-lactamase class C family)